MAPTNTTNTPNLKTTSLPPPTTTTQLPLTPANYPNPLLATPSRTPQVWASSFWTTCAQIKSEGTWKRSQLPLTFASPKKTSEKPSDT